MKQKVLNFFFATLLSFAYLAGYSQTDTVYMEGVEFIPGILEVAVGTEVVWINNSSTVHTSTSGEDCNFDGMWDSGDIPAGDTYSRVFDTEGSNPYFCDYHCLAGMTGYVDVTSSASIAELEASGISIKSLGPIPSRGEVYLDLEIIESGKVDITVFDLKGVKVMKVRNDRHYEPGEYRITINGNMLDSGIYLCRIISDADAVTQKISIR